MVERYEGDGIKLEVELTDELVELMIKETGKTKDEVIRFFKLYMEELWKLFPTLWRFQKATGNEIDYLKVAALGLEKAKERMNDESSRE